MRWTRGYFQCEEASLSRDEGEESEWACLPRNTEGTSGKRDVHEAGQFDNSSFEQFRNLHLQRWTCMTQSSEKMFQINTLLEQTFTEQVRSSRSPRSSMIQYSSELHDRRFRWLITHSLAVSVEVHALEHEKLFANIWWWFRITPFDDCQCFGLLELGDSLSNCHCFVFENVDHFKTSFAVLRRAFVLAVSAQYNDCSYCSCLGTV